MRGVSILIVGDSPAPKNVCPTIPFVGTQSYKRLLEWIWELDVDISKVGMVNQSDNALWGDIHTLAIECSQDAKIIALGNKAYDAVVKLNKEHDLDVFKLPHPSGRNYQLNNKKWLSEQLKLCKNWLSS